MYDADTLTKQPKNIFMINVVVNCVPTKLNCKSEAPSKWHAHFSDCHLWSITQSLLFTVAAELIYFYIRDNRLRQDCDVKRLRCSNFFISNIYVHCMEFNECHKCTKYSIQFDLATKENRRFGIAIQFFTMLMAIDSNLKSTWASWEQHSLHSQHYSKCLYSLYINGTHWQILICR